MPLPKSNEGRINWSLNFDSEFPSIGANFGFSPEEITASLLDSRTMRFVIQNGLSASAYAKAANSYKYDLLGKSKDGVNAPDTPAYTGTAAPGQLSEPGILDRFSEFEKRLKAHPNYNDAVGDLLMINAPESDAPVAEDTKPTGQAISLPGSVVRIDWIKGKFDGVLIEGQRGDETNWSKLDRDFRSPFEDDRPLLESGKPEERRYRLRYLDNDEPFGEYSDVLVAVTKG